MAEMLVSKITELVSLPMAVIIKYCPVLAGTTQSQAGRKEQWDTVGPGTAAAVSCLAEEGEV